MIVKELAYFVIMMSIILYATRLIPTAYCILEALGFWMLATVLSWKLATSNKLWSATMSFHEKVSSNNKAVLITGCDSGFGNQLAKRLYQRGFQVYAGCLDDNGKGAADLREMDGMNADRSRRMHILRLNVTKTEDIQVAYENVKSTLKDNVFWAVVNNAGITASTEIEWGSIKVFRNVFDVNVFGLIEVTRTFLPLLRQSSGRVVLVASLAGHIPAPYAAAYSASKASVISFGESLRREMQKFDIKVITIEPSYYETPHTSTDAKIRTVNAIWEETSEDIKRVYGEEYFKRFKKVITNAQVFNSSKVYQVIDCLQDAIENTDPPARYRCFSMLKHIHVLSIIKLLLPYQLIDFFEAHIMPLLFGNPAYVEAKKSKLKSIKELALIR